MSARRATGPRAPGNAADQMPVRVYRVLLRAYPAAFRREYGREMTLVFRDQQRDSGSRVRFWVDLACDVLRSAPIARAEAFRARRAGFTQNEEEEVMRPMALLAVLFGAVDVLNAGIEARAGWAGEGGAAWLASLVGAVLAGVLLAVAGIVLLRRASAGGTLARAAIVASLAIFAGMAFVHPWMSIFARLVGIGFPLTLMAFLLTRRGRGPTAFAS
jgi:hypothetical protein